MVGCRLQLSRTPTQLLDKARTSGYSAADLERLAGGLFDDLTDAQTLDLVESRLAGTHLGRTLSALLAESGRDVEKLKENLEVWFNNSMDRVGGWYKRKTQWVHLLLAAALTVGINVDSIQVVQNLAHNAALRDSLVAQAQTYAKQNLQPGSNAEASYTALRTKLSELDLPVGWWIAGPGVVAPTDAATSYRYAPTSLAESWATLRYHFWGWLLTAIAISLGAPFWFDMLNKVITIRSSGKAPEEKPKAPKEVPQPLEPGQSPPA